MAKKVTIQDISKAAHTSPSTVSRVLTGSARVSQAKRLAVEEAINRFGYRPSHIARSLKTNTTFSVGLLLNDITNTFYGVLARGVEEEATRDGYSLILCNTNEDPERELHYLKVLQDKSVDGIILGPTGENIDYIRDLALRIPLLQVDRQLPGVDIPAVVVDNEDAAYQATRLLLKRGHRRIAVIKWKRRPATMEQRYAGYKRALSEAGIALDPDLVVEIDGITAAAAAEVVKHFLSTCDRPLALVALNNHVGLGVMSAIRQLGLHMPQDISLIVFDDLEFFSLSIPSISAIAQPAFAIGERAMQLLLEQMRAPESVPNVVVLPTELIVRDSIASVVAS